MPAWRALATLGAICALSGCFEVKYGDCRVTCTRELGCPANLTCLIERETASSGLCAPPGMKTCLTNPDAATDASDAREAGVDAEASTAAGPPSMLCHNGSCLSLSESIRKNLVLLLWPSNLPPVGSTVPVWADQSGQGNDARALSLTAAPQVFAHGVQFDSTQAGGGFIVRNSSSLDFGSGDFAVIVVGGLSSGATPVSFFRKSDSARTNSRQISIDWGLSSSQMGGPEGAVNDTVLVATASLGQPAVYAYTLERANDHVELHVNGTVLSSADLPGPGASTSNAADAYVGVSNVFSRPAASIEAVIAIRGQIESSDFNGLETFLRTLFATMP